MKHIIDTEPKAKAFIAYISDVRSACFDIDTQNKRYDFDIDAAMLDNMSIILLNYMNGDKTIRNLVTEILERP